MGSGRGRVIVAQVLRGSFVTWALCGALIASIRILHVEHRERVADDPGGLTPLGLALFVVPQLVGVAAWLG